MQPIAQENTEIKTLEEITKSGSIMVQEFVNRAPAGKAGDVILTIVGLSNHGLPEIAAMVGDDTGDVTPEMVKALRDDFMAVVKQRLKGWIESRTIQDIEIKTPMGRAFLLIPVTSSDERRQTREALFEDFCAFNKEDFPILTAIPIIPTRSIQ